MRRPAATFACLLVCLGVVVGCGPRASARPHGVVVVIGDGMGFAQVTLARQMLLEPGERWSFERLRVTGIVSTPSASNATTDSGAAATAMASGVKTSNQRIGTDPAGESLRSISEAALDAGWRVGYVTTTTLTHATPAAFYAHVLDRYTDEAEIAAQLVAHRADVALGGGRGVFLPQEELGERLDGRNLVREAESAGWTVWARGDDLGAEPPERLLGLLANSHFAFRIDDARQPEERRDPSLARLTELALTVLSRSGDPFFLVVEGGRIDHACHDFDAAGAAYEVADLAAAVEVVTRFRATHPRTLVLVTADHATGGLAINDYVDWEALRRQRASVEWMAEQIRNVGAGAALVREMTGFDDIRDEDLEAVRTEPEKYEAWRHLGRLLAARHGVTWIPSVGPDTWGHTGEDVPLYAAGPGAPRFQGVLDNTDISDRLRELTGLE